MYKIEIKPLSINEAYTGKRFKTKKYKAYIKNIQWLLPKNIEIYKKIALNIKVGFTSRGSDIDNVQKPFIDILQKQYGFNDNQIFKITIEKEIVKEPYIAFEIIDFSNFKGLKQIDTIQRFQDLNNNC